MIMQTKKIVVPILFLLISVVCNAQNSPPMPIPPPPPGLPIDAGVLLGACFAVAYGAKKLLKKE